MERLHEIRMMLEDWFFLAAIVIVGLGLLGSMAVFSWRLIINQWNKLKDGGS